MSGLQRLLYLLCPALLFVMAAVHLVVRLAEKLAMNSVTGWIESQMEMVPPVARTMWWVLLVVIPVGMVVLYCRQLFTRNILVFKTEAGHPLKIRDAAVNRLHRLHLVEAGAEEAGDVLRTGLLQPFKFRPRGPE